MLRSKEATMYGKNFPPDQPHTAMSKHPTTQEHDGHNAPTKMSWLKGSQESAGGKPGTNGPDAIGIEAAIKQRN
jgi:hypothetical protein